MTKRTAGGARLSGVFRLAGLTALGVCVLAAQPPADDLIARVETRYNRAQTLSVRFVEDFAIQGRPRPSETGTLVLRKQGKMRWEYTRPAGKLFISDGKTVYLFTAQDNRVEKIPLRHTEDMRAPLAFLLGHLQLKKEFRDLESHPGEGGTWLDASAKSDRIAYEQVKMLIGENGEVRHLKILGRDGSWMSFAFSDEKLNPVVPAGAFDFQIPPGAQVVDALEFGMEGK